jgi:hypothetical protein
MFIALEIFAGTIIFNDLSAKYALFYPLSLFFPGEGTGAKSSL